MIALDANQLARLLLQDEAAHYKKVKTLFRTRQTFTVPITVKLRLVWVLESRDCSAEKIVGGLTALLNLPNFKLDRVDAFRMALQSYESGMGFADALHLALSEDQQKVDDI